MYNGTVYNCFTKLLLFIQVFYIRNIYIMFKITEIKKFEIEIKHNNANDEIAKFISIIMIFTTK